MDNEIKSFIKVWIIAITSLCYCYYIASRFPKGVLRFISLLHIFYLFIILPLDLHSFHLGAPTTFFLVWLGTFKLFFFSFDHGPLSSSSSQKNLFHFISIACLPIKMKTKPTSNHKQKPISPKLPKITSKIPNQRKSPQINLWGRIWNLMVTSILRPTTYDPIWRLSTHLIRSKFAYLPAIMAVFIVSRLMHVAIYYYLSQAKPTWEVTWIFVFQRVCTATKLAVKKVAGGKCRVNRAVSSCLALGFLVVSGNWLFFPQLLRIGVHGKAINMPFWGILSRQSLHFFA
ncbi:hypothetical protein UlMin_003738 [Ulmus minor]